MKWQCQATDKFGRVSTSTHKTKEQAQESAKCCRGRYPWGNRVKVVEIPANPIAISCSQETKTID